MRSRRKQGGGRTLRELRRRQPTPADRRLIARGIIKITDGKVPVYCDFHPLPGSARGNIEREAAEVAFLEAYEQTPLTGWQTHQWEKAMNAKPKVLRGGKLVRPQLERYPFSKLERRGTLEHV